MRALRAATATLLLIGSGCGDLEVTNPNNPDRERSTSEPGDVQTLISTSFLNYWPMVEGNWPGMVLSTLGDDASSGFADYDQHILSGEPRIAFNNSTANARRDLAEDPWYELYGVISNVNDALAAIDGGLVITESGVDQTPRARAFGKFMQGLAHGYLALYFDRASISDETMDPATDDYPLVASDQVLAAALSQLDEAVAIATANTFTIPSTGWIPGLTLTNQDLVRIARTFQAKFLAYHPRTRADRDKVPWSQVLTYIDAGITKDYSPVAIPLVLFSDFRRLLARQRTTTPGDYARLDYYLVGPADTVGGFQSWLALTPGSRNPFQLRTRDRRIVGPTGGTTVGKYFGYHVATIFAADRGTYHRSYYYYKRAGTTTTWENGPQQWLTRTEMDLLKAEALLRLNRAAEAVPLINLTRVANGELPPVTIEGPPLGPGCIPRKLNGQCGSLWDALRYEKRIEMTGVEPAVAWYDARGWQTLIEASLTQLPIPARELEVTRAPLYTFGGQNPGGSAPPPTPEACPVPLPRC
jgi:hypothetical protein